MTDRTSAASPMVKLFGRQRAATEPSLIRPSAVMRSYQRLSREPETCWAAFRRWRIRLRIRMRLRVLMLYGALKLDPIAARSTFRLTLSTVMAVLLSRSWDFFFVNHFWGVDGVPGLACPGRLQYFSAMVLAGGVFAALLPLPTEGRRPMMVALLLASEGLLIGWSFKGVVSECHSSTTRALGVMGSMLPLFTLGFATMSTLVAVTLVYATDRLVIDCSSKRGPRSLTAIVFKRWHEILASGVGLGVAAGWDDTLERLVSIDAYAAFAAGGACGHDASLLGDLPSPLLLYVLYAVSLVSACVIGHMQLNALRQKDGEKLSAIMSTRLQAYERGRQARMRWYAAIDEMKRMESPQRRSARASLLSMLIASGEQKAGGPPRRSVSEPTAGKRPRAGSMPVQSSLPLSGKLDAIGKGFAAGLRRKRTRLEAALAIRALQGRIHLASVLEKVLGFVVGWAVYDVAKQAHTPDSPLDFLGFATALTLICAGYTLLFGKEFKAHDRESAERIFLANALGMVQGWSWADFTGMCLRDLLEEPHLAAYPHSASFAATVVVTAIVIALRISLARLLYSKQAVAAWKRALRKIRGREGIHGLVQKIKEIGPPHTFEKRSARHTLEPPSPERGGALL